MGARAHRVQQGVHQRTQQGPTKEPNNGSRRPPRNLNCLAYFDTKHTTFVFRLRHVTFTRFQIGFTYVSDSLKRTRSWTLSLVILHRHVCALCAATWERMPACSFCNARPRNLDDHVWKIHKGWPCTDGCVDAKGALRRFRRRRHRTRHTGKCKPCTHCGIHVTNITISVLHWN